MTQIVVGQYPQFSIATDLSGIRSLKKDQRYYSLGQSISSVFHLSKKNSAYLWFVYYTNGKFKNDVVATAKTPLVFPANLSYVNNAKMRLRHFSVGWRHYFIGEPLSETKWNLYGLVGLGLLAGKLENTHSIAIDTTEYNVPVQSGIGDFKRLTLDLGAGWELPIGGSFFVYTETRTFIPTTDYPSKYLFVNNKAPINIMISLGLRLTFD